MAINKVTNVNPVQQTQLQEMLETLQKNPELSPLLGGNSVTVSNAPVDLEALVAKLGAETTHTQEDLAKMNLSSVFTTIIARAEETVMQSEQNQVYLNEASELNKQLKDTENKITTNSNDIIDLNQKIQADQKQVDQAAKAVRDLAKTVNQAQQGVNSEQQKVNALADQVAATTAAISELETQLMAESDLGIRAQLLNEIDEKTQDLAMQNSLLANEQAKLTTAENKLADAQAKLTEAENTLNEAKATLEADRTARTAKQSEIEADKNTKADLAYQVGEKLNSIVDIEDLLAEIERLSENVDDVLQFNQDLEKERGEEEEKFLDTHSTLRILQDAAARHDLDILDTIATKREEKV